MVARIAESWSVLIWALWSWTTWVHMCTFHLPIWKYPTLKFPNIKVSQLMIPKYLNILTWCSQISPQVHWILLPSAEHPALKIHLVAHFHIHFVNTQMNLIMFYITCEVNMSKRNNFQSWMVSHLWKACCLSYLCFHCSHLSWISLRFVSNILTTHL